MNAPGAMATPFELFNLFRSCRAGHARERMAEELVLAIGPALLRFIGRHVPESPAEDVFQEVLRTLFGQADRCQARDEAGFRGWYYAIARRQCANHWRRNQPTESLEEMDLETVLAASLEAEPAGIEEQDELAYALELLAAAKPPCLAYLWDRFGLGLSFAELAQKYEVAIDTITRRVQRCLKLARTLVAGEQDDG